MVTLRKVEPKQQMLKYKFSLIIIKHPIPQGLGCFLFRPPALVGSKFKVQYTKSLASRNQIINAIHPAKPQSPNQGSKFQNGRQVISNNPQPAIDRQAQN